MKQPAFPLVGEMGGAEKHPRMRYWVGSQGAMCLSCASRNPEKQLDSRFRGNDIQGGEKRRISLPRSMSRQWAEEKIDPPFG
jgi:hypothetical protein